MLGLVAPFAMWIHIAACGDPADGDVESTNSAEDEVDIDAADGSGEGGIRYTFDWVLDGVELGGDDVLRVFTNQGYEVTLTRLGIVSYTADLVPCAESTAASTSFWDWLSPPARAGHGFALDPSTMLTPIAEAGPPLVSVSSGVIDAGTGRRYCRVHVVIAAAPDEPSYGEAAGLNLRVRGSWRQAGQAGSTELDIDSTLAHGAFFDLETPLVLGSERVEVVVTRTLKPVLDSIDFANSTTDDVARQLLINLLTHAAVNLR